MSQNLSRAIAVVGIDIGKNSFHVVGLDERGAIALSDVVAWPSWSTTCQYAAMPDRHGGLRRCTSAACTSTCARPMCPAERANNWHGLGSELLRDNDTEARCDLRDQPHQHRRTLSHSA